MQPKIEEVDDEYDLEQQIQSYIIDPYGWDPSAEHSPSDEDMDDVYKELMGEKVLGVNHLHIMAISMQQPIYQLH
jgi:hypothetical protein